MRLTRCGPQRANRKGRRKPPEPGQNHTKFTCKTEKAMIPAVKTKPVACKLTTPEFRERKKHVIAILKSKVLEKTELENGYCYSFEGSDTMLDSLVAFIKTERQCCNFFTFNLCVLDDPNCLRLTLTGPEGVKEFIRAELGL
jgi:hypothetical protein